MARSHRIWFKQYSLVSAFALDKKGRLDRSHRGEPHEHGIEESRGLDLSCPVLSSQKSTEKQGATKLTVLTVRFSRGTGSCVELPFEQPDRWILRLKRPAHTTIDAKLVALGVGRGVAVIVVPEREIRVKVVRQFHVEGKFRSSAQTAQI